MWIIKPSKRSFVGNPDDYQNISSMRHVFFTSNDMWPWGFAFNLNYLVHQKKFGWRFENVLGKFLFRSFRKIVLSCNTDSVLLRLQVTATDGDKDRAQNIVYFLTGQGIDPDNPANSKFDINRTTGEISVLKVSASFYSGQTLITRKRTIKNLNWLILWWH